MRIVKNKDFFGIGFIITKDITVIRLGYYLIEIYNFNKKKYNI